MEHVKEHSDGQAGKRIDERREERQRGNQARRTLTTVLQRPAFLGGDFPSGDEAVLTNNRTNERLRGKPRNLQTVRPVMNVARLVDVFSRRPAQEHGNVAVRCLKHKVRVVRSLQAAETHLFKRASDRSDHVNQLRRLRKVGLNEGCAGCAAIGPVRALEYHQIHVMVVSGSHGNVLFGLMDVHAASHNEDQQYQSASGRSEPFPH